MDKDVISIDPQIIQFGPDSKHLIKVINKSNQLIQNCFFCLFNTSKYQFSPESFSLQPKQHKLITLTLKLKVTDNGGKQFAYLKSKNFNKRLTLITNRKDPSSDEKRGIQNEGVEQINTLTSRDYKQSQKLGYQKIISQKQAYIRTLERKLQERSQLCLQQQHFEYQNNKIYLDEIQKLQLQIQIMKKQNQQLVMENFATNQKFKDYQLFASSQGKTSQLGYKLQQAQRQIEAQAEEIKCLQIQCEQFLKKLEEKQSIIKEMQFVYASKIDGIVKQGEKKLQQLESKIQQERRNFESLSKNSQKAEKLQQKLKNVQQQLDKKQKELASLTQRLDEQKHLNRKLSSQSKKALKSLAETETIVEQNKQLKSKVEQLQRICREQKQQTIIYKNKLSDHDSSTEKVHQYLQMALSSCKNENQILKKSKQDLEHLLQQQGKSKRYFENKTQSLDQNLKQATNKIKQLQQIKQKLNSEKIAQRQQNHDKIMQLKSENIDLIEKINFQKRKQKQNQEQTQQLKSKLLICQRQLQKLRTLYNELLSKHNQTLQQKQKVQKKIDKYRKQAKNSLRTISDNAKDELKRIEQQKNKLQRKVQELQLSARELQTTRNQNRNKTKTQCQDHKQTQIVKQKCHMSFEGDRRIGIKNQRRSLQESQTNSRSQIDMDKIYTQLGQLRQFKNYVGNQIRKLKIHLGIYDEAENNQNSGKNPIFNAINFFKDLQHKIEGRNEKESKLLEAEKQIQFLKGRLTELQPIAKNLKSKERQYQQQSSSKQQVDLSTIEYLRQEMKSQYKKLYDALKLSQLKYEVMRKKIYEEYRARIIQLISKKDKDQYTIGRIETLIERFVQGLANTSHKQAVLAKEIKLKQQARREASVLKQKLTAVNKHIQSNSNKKGVSCIRDPTRTFQLQNQNQYLDKIKLQAKVLTFEAQNARLETDKSVSVQKLTEAEQQLKLCQADLQTKQQQIERLKKQVIEITKQNDLQTQKLHQQMQGYKKKFSAMQKMEKQISDLQIKEKQNNHLREEVQQKREIIKSLRQREKMLEQLLDESRKNESSWKDREKKEYLQQSRMQQTLKDMKQNNRELRSQNASLKEQVDQLIQELNKKNVAMKRLKSQTEQHRIRNVKSQIQSIQKLRSQISSLKQELKKSKQENDKQKRKKDRQISQLQSQINRLKSQFTIQKSSLESIVRALVDTMKGIYCSLEIIARKKGKQPTQQVNFDALTSEAGEIRTTKLRKHFDQVIDLVKD